jgi:hypothetical protein
VRLVSAEVGPAVRGAGGHSDEGTGTDRHNVVVHLEGELAGEDVEPLIEGVVDGQGGAQTVGDHRGTRPYGRYVDRP